LAPLEAGLALESLLCAILAFEVNSRISEAGEKRF
jgi:hypothetical protein